MLIKSGEYLQNLQNLMAFYAKFDDKDLSKCYLNEQKIQNYTKII
jgi:hypothetical protein